MILALLACSADGPALTVLAASSLTGAFEDLEGRFARRHEGEVRLSFAGSQALATQIRHGLDADVFASADVAHAESLTDEGLLEPPTPFATGGLAVVVPVDRPALGLAEIPSVERLVVGDAPVPVGRYTEALLDAAEVRYGRAWREAVDRSVVSREPSARLVVAKVALGEADAGIAYTTDVRPGVRGTPVPAELGPRAVYVHAPLIGAEPAARDWLAFVASEEGRAVLAAHGFGVP